MLHVSAWVSNDNNKQQRQQNQQRKHENNNNQQEAIAKIENHRSLAWTVVLEVPC